LIAWDFRSGYQRSAYLCQDDVDNCEFVALKFIQGVDLVNRISGGCSLNGVIETVQKTVSLVMNTYNMIQLIEQSQFADL
jgi:hypothetical protein